MRIRDWGDRREENDKHGEFLFETDSEVTVLELKETEKRE